MHELVPVAATPEHEHRRAVGHEVEEQCHHAQPTVAEHRAGPHDRDVEPGGDRIVAQRARLEAWRGRRARADGNGVLSVTGLCSGMPNTALDDVCTTFATRASRAADQHVGGSADVHLVEQRAVLGQGHLGDVVEHDVDALTGGAHRLLVAHVARDELGAGERRSGRVEVEDPDRVSPGERQFGQDGPEVTAAARDQDGASHQRRSPRSRHHRTLARMPSNRSTAGSYPSSLRAREMSQAIVSFNSPSTCTTCT